MNRNQKEVQQAFLKSEEEILQELNAIYLQAQIDVEDKIFELMNRKDIENLQSIIYQIDYQKALKKQIDSVLDNLNSNQFKSISEYLIKCYNDGFIGTMYDLQGQGLPFIFPINQKEIVRAVKLDSKINGSMYSHFGENIEELKKDISREIARGISTGTSYQIIGKNIKNNMLGDYKNTKGAYAYAVRIARTEGHRIQIQSTMDAQQKAKEAGANIVKQWDSALDGRTRPTHRMLDGQIRELDEDFEVEGKSVSAPGMFGNPAEDCNCRCALLQRAKWALDEEELEALKERAEYFGLDKTKDFEDFKSKYLQSQKEIQKKEDNINNHLQKIAKNKDGQEIVFDLKSLRHPERVETAQQLLTDLLNKYNTFLTSVGMGAKNAAGSVGIGGNMNLSSLQPEIILHEFAHSMAQQSRIKYKIADKNEIKLMKEISKIRSKYEKECASNPSVSISSYSHTNKDEFLAEAFCHAKSKEFGFELSTTEYGSNFKYSNMVLESINKYMKK